MLLMIVVAMIAVLALVALVIASRPAQFRIERNAIVGAPPEVVHGIINDLSQWGQWSPYEGRDPNMKKSFEGPSSGPGAVYIWNGNNQVGEGKLSIVDTNPGRLVRMKLEFTRPFKCTNDVNFVIAPEPAGSRVSWIMDGKNNFVSKAMSLFIDMDKMVGTDFEHGLANLDRIASSVLKSVQHV